MENRALVIAVATVGIGLAGLMLNGQRVTGNAIERLRDNVGDLREPMARLEVSMTHIETRMTRIEDILGYAKSEQGD